MLKKSILLNLEIGSKDFYNAFCAAVSLGVLGILTMMLIVVGPVVFFVGFIVSAVFMLKGLDQMFCKSLFDDSGALYMTLPLSPRDTVLGKLIAALLYIELISMVQILTVAAAAVFLNGVITISGFDFIYYIVKPYLDLQLPPAAVAGLWALIPLKIIISQLAVLAMLLAVSLLWNVHRPGNAGSIFYILYLAGNLLLLEVSGLLKKVLQEVLGNFYLAEGLFSILSAVFTLSLIWLCCRILEKNYNFR